MANTSAQTHFGALSRPTEIKNFACCMPKAEEALLFFEQHFPTNH